MSKPNKVMLASIDSARYQEEALRNKRRVMVMAIDSWSVGGDCYENKKHIPGFCDEQKGYFMEGLNLIDKYLKKFNK